MPYISHAVLETYILDVITCDVCADTASVQDLTLGNPVLLAIVDSCSPAVYLGIGDSHIWVVAAKRADEAGCYRQSSFGKPLTRPYGRPRGYLTTSEIGSRRWLGYRRRFELWTVGILRCRCIHLEPCLISAPSCRKTYSSSSGISTCYRVQPLMISYIP